MTFLITLTARGAAEVKPWTWDPTEDIDTQIQQALGLPVDPAQRMRLALHARGAEYLVWTTPQPDDIEESSSHHRLNLVATEYLEQPTVGPIAITGHDPDHGICGLTTRQVVEEGTYVAEEQARIRARLAWLQAFNDMPENDAPRDARICAKARLIWLQGLLDH